MDDLSHNPKWRAQYDAVPQPDAEFEAALQGQRVVMPIRIVSQPLYEGSVWLPPLKQGPAA